jgi:hypothetical protein
MVLLVWNNSLRSDTFPHDSGVGSTLVFLLLLISLSKV